ncbi:rho GTPase-activating protein 12-like isoform X4 [Antennarius striatus]|uniref:rho GTPase-activating protein 12-like isoform X4 n=1 Tax=Antennarius striatus TaxID=241820 RepID=UPI0035B1AF1D
MADLPIAPGEVYIEVEYDYEYKAKERVISIHQGECYMLVKKANEDWWQVRKEEGSKAFYVPAQYVREVRKALMPPSKTALHPPAAPSNALPSAAAATAALWVKPSNLELGLQEGPGGDLHRQESNRRSPSTHAASCGAPSTPGQRRDSSQHQGPGGPSSPSQHERALADILVQGAQPDQGGKSNTLPRARAQSPDLDRAPLDLDRTPLDLDRSPHGDSGEERHTNESESGDELSSSSTELLQDRSQSDSPVYTNLQELKITQTTHPPTPSGPPLSIHGDWETHKDPTGRLFYHNRSTHETTWKPPRAPPRDAATRGERYSLGESVEWLKHVDEQGRPYYYSADGSRSEWELPKYKRTPPHLPLDAARTRSLDRKYVEPIVLTKWRHSTHIQEDPHDKEAPWGPKPSSPDADSCPSSPKPPSPPEMGGVLNVTKITEHGKKVRKNWTSSWTVLQGSSLLFAKSQGGGTSWFGAQSSPEFTVDLRGGSVEWASKDKSSKKHVLELKTRQGTELLVQSENEGVVSDWYHALQDAISTHAWESDEALEDDPLDSPVGEKQDRDSKKVRAMKTSTSVDGSDHKKTRHKLKKFLTRRPTLQSVRDKGYIRDQVFGCSLSILCQRENGSVPSFVTLCIDHVENNGLWVDGLYRVSGNLAVIQKLRFAVDHDEKLDLLDRKWEDIHVTTGALKMFFRELPEPLFTYSRFQDFIRAIKISDYRLRVQAVRDLVQQLPRPNHDTMKVLFRHLRKVIEHGEENRMTTQGVAIVFGPTLLRPETESWNMAVHMVYQNQIVELVLLEFDSIFSR